MPKTQTVTSKGQVLLPKKIRDQVGIKPGEEVIVEIKDGAIVIKQNKKPSWMKLRGILKGTGYSTAQFLEERRKGDH